MSESTPVKMPHWWKSHIVAQLLYFIYEYSFLYYSVPEYFSEYVETEDEEIFYILELELAKVSRCTLIFGPHSDKTCLRGFRQSEFRTSLLNY